MPTCDRCQYRDYHADEIARTCCGAGPAGGCRCASGASWLCPVCWSEAEALGEVSSASMSPRERAETAARVAELIAGRA